MNTGIKSPEKSIVVRRELCGSCGACVAVCQQNALFLLNAYLYVDAAACTACRRCVRVCPVRALSLVDVDMQQPAEVLL
ncbi:MAG: 4Fe-4S binding protein [Anaerolineae bacterium]|nr:4Fe-4S binding protein [Anaerolineae bacterium]